MDNIKINTLVEFDFFDNKETGIVTDIDDDIAYIEANLIGFLSTYTLPVSELTIKK